MPAVALTAPVWLKQLESLRGQHCLIVIHAPGYGLSKVIRECTAAGVSRVFSEVLQRLVGAQPAHLVSSCLGSIAASHLARFSPQQVASLTMVGGFYDGADLSPVKADNLSIEELTQMIQAVSGSLKLDFDTVAAQWPLDDPRRLEAERVGNLLIGSQCANPLVAIRYLNEMSTLSALDWIRQLTMPVQFLFGDLDTVIRPVHSRTMHAELAGSGLTEIKGSGHYPFLTHASAFDGVLSRFVQQVDAGLTPAEAPPLSVGSFAHPVAS
jgi:pimeloyl-ACP methyl ester carboxylesterase